MSVTQQQMQFRLAVDGQAQVIDAMGRTAQSMSRVEDAQGRMAQSAAVAASGMRGLLAAVGIGISVKGIIDAADAVTTLQNTLKLATGSTAAATAAYEDLFRIAQSSRVSFTELGGTYASIARAGQALGLSQSRLLTVTEAIGNAMTISGGSAESMKDALVQLSQGLSSGTLRGDELNSVIEQTPRLAQALADGLGVSTGELRKLGEAGSLTAEKVIGALEKSAPQLAKEVQGATMTVGQAFTVLTNSAVKFVGEADKASGASNTLASAMKALGGAIDTAGEFIRKHETAFALIGGSLAGATAAAGILAVGAAVKMVAGAVGALGLALAANPVVLTLLGIGAVVGAVAAGTNAARNSMAGMAGEIESLTQRIATAQKQLDSVPEDKRGALTKGLEDRLAAMRARLAEVQQQYAASVVSPPSARKIDNQLDLQQAAQQQQSVKDLAEIRQKLSGIDKEYLPTLEKLNTARQLGTLSEKEYIAQVSELATQTYKASDADKEAEAAKKKAAQAAEQNADRVKSLMDATDAKVAAGQLELQQLRDHDGTQQQLTKAQEYALGVLERLRTGEVKLTTAQATRLAVKLEQLDADERARQQEQRDDKWAQQSGDESARAIEAAQQQANSLQEQALAQQRANEAIGLSAAGVAELEAARLRDTAAAKDQYAAALEAASPTLAAAYREQAQGLRDIAEAKLAGATKQATVDAANEAAQQWRQVFDQAGQSLADALMRGGKSAGEQLKQYLQTLVVRASVQAVIVNPLQNALGLNAAAGGATTSQGFGLLNMASTLSSAYNVYTAGLTSTLASAMSSAGSAFGSSALSSFASGMKGATLGAGMAGPTTAGASGAMGLGATVAKALPVVGWIMAGMQLNGSLWDKGWQYKSSDLPSLLRPAGWFYDGLMGGPLLDKLFGGKTASMLTGSSLVARAFGRKAPEIERQGIEGAFGGDGFVGTAYADIVRKGGWFRSNKHWTERTALDAGVQAQLSDTFTGMRDSVADMARALGQPVAAISGYTKQIKLAFTADEAANKKLIDETFSSIGEDLAKSALGAAGQTLAKASESAAQTLSRLSTSLKSVNQTLDTLGATALRASLQGADAASKLADAFGGLDAFTQTAGAYYQAYYSDAERTATATRQLTAQFGELGYALPESRTQLRGWIDGLIDAGALMTDDGRGTVASLMSLAEAFASITDAAQQAGKGLQDEINRLRGATADSTAAGLAALQAQFATSTAAARAGDSAALERLPELSQAIEAAATATAASALDVSRMRAWLASSLQATLGITVPAFADGGDHLGGLRLVGERGMELEATGPARYYSNEQLGRMLSRSGADDELKQLMHQVLAVLEAFSAQSGNGNVAIAGHLAKLARLIERAMRPGSRLAVQVETAEA